MQVEEKEIKANIDFDNNMDHSMLTAMDTTKNIKNNIESKENIWNENTEKQYHKIRSN